MGSPRCDDGTRNVMKKHDVISNEINLTPVSQLSISQGGCPAVTEDCSSIPELMDSNSSGMTEQSLRLHDELTSSTSHCSGALETLSNERLLNMLLH